MSARKSITANSTEAVQVMRRQDNSLVSGRSARERCVSAKVAEQQREQHEAAARRQEIMTRRERRAKKGVLYTPPPYP
ncbi:hypothetical protein H0H92_012586 [Tricholoma furcatifolium]|nr:hypothetical protein H0H92_012586 [Tricholoma furcatifolium]